MKPTIYLFLPYILVMGCTKNLPTKTEVFNTNFENNKFDEFEISNPNGVVAINPTFVFNGTTVYGPFNTNYVQLHITNLPFHNALRVEFDLYIHDNWKGNFKEPGRTSPDLWTLALDNSTLMNTSFSNVNGYYHSFPDNYVDSLNPYPAKGNAYESNLPARCSNLVNSPGTSKYKIDMVYAHTINSAYYGFTDAIQAQFSICNKSWSIDNIVVTAIDYKKGY